MVQDDSQQLLVVYKGVAPREWLSDVLIPGWDTQCAGVVYPTYLCVFAE